MTLDDRVQVWFPPEKGWEIIENQVGHSEARLFILYKKETAKWVLKCQPVGTGPSLEQEAEHMKWLRQFLPVPRSKWYAGTPEWEYLLLDYLPGSSAFDYPEKEKIGHLLGLTLKRIHLLLPGHFPQAQNRSPRLLEAYLSQYPEQAEAVQALIPKQWDLVISHGDFCLPNVLFNEGRLSGIVDLGAFGIYDRYHDLYWGIWSLKYNQLEEQIPMFIKAYGVQQLDEQKLELMRLLNQH